MPSSRVTLSSDVDEFRAAIRPSNTEFTINGRGRFTACSTRIDLHHLRMQRAQEVLPRAWHIENHPARTAILFQTEPGPVFSWCGVEIEDNEVTPVAAGQSGWHRLSGATSWGSMSLPTEYLAAISADVAGRDLTPSHHGRAIAVPLPVMARLQRLHAAAGQLAETAPEIIANPDAARGLEQQLMEAMLACVGGTEVRQDTAALRRHAAIVERFRAAAMARTDRAVYLTEVCAEIGVNVRTLLLCCQEQLGMGPKHYLHLRRLHMARQALRAVDPRAGCITEIATRYGFWELGRFAAYYKQVFGESPSATLQPQLRRPRPGVHANVPYRSTESSRFQEAHLVH
jgi:AraC-like DNA-binding protein